MTMALITDLDEVRRLANERFDEFDVLRYQLQFDDAIDDVKLDAWVEVVAAPIVASVDCKQCGNCCRALTVGLTSDDAGRLAAHIGCSVNQLSADYIERDVEEEWGIFKQRPCAFLKGKLCSVYEHRPEVCRQYPQFTPDFRWTLEQMNDGAALCPIIYNVLSQILEREREIYAL